MMTNTKTTTQTTNANSLFVVDYTVAGVTITIRFHDKSKALDYYDAALSTRGARCVISVDGITMLDTAWQ